MPFSNLKDLTVYNITYREDEGLLKAALCTAQKIGNGAKGCFIVPRPDLRARWEDRLKRNHYIYEVVAEVPDEEMEVLSTFIKRKMGFGPKTDRVFGGHDTSEAPPCNMGFCDV